MNCKESLFASFSSGEYLELTHEQTARMIIDYYPSTSDYIMNGVWFLHNINCTVPRLNDKLALELLEISWSYYHLNQDQSLLVPMLIACSLSMKAYLKLGTVKRAVMDRFYTFIQQNPLPEPPIEVYNAQLNYRFYLFSLSNKNDREFSLVLRDIGQFITDKRQYLNYHPERTGQYLIPSQSSHCLLRSLSSFLFILIHFCRRVQRMTLIVQLNKLRVLIETSNMINRLCGDSEYIGKFLLYLVNVQRIIDSNSLNLDYFKLFLTKITGNRDIEHKQLLLSILITAKPYLNDADNIRYYNDLYREINKD